MIMSGAKFNGQENRSKSSRTAAAYSNRLLSNRPAGSRRVRRAKEEQAHRSKYFPERPGAEEAGARRPGAKRLDVLRARDFRLFYVGYATSLLGTAMSSVAIAFAFLGSGGTATGLGVVFTANIAAMVALMLVGGALADRIGRRLVMLTADIVRCVAQGALAAALAAGRPSLWLFVTAAFVVGTGNAFFSPALSGLPVQLAPPGLLGDANALLGAARPAAQVAGPALAGILIAVTSPALVIAVDAVTYAISALALAGLGLADGAPHSVPARGARPRGLVRRKPDDTAPCSGPGRNSSPPGSGGRDLQEAADGPVPRAHDPAAQENAASRDPGPRRPAGSGSRGRGGQEPRRLGGGTSLRHDVAEGWAEFKSHPWLWPQTVQFALFNLVTWGPYLVLGPVLAEEYLGGARAWGTVLSCYGGGAILGSLLALGREPRRPLLVATLATFGYALPPLGLALRLPLPAVAAAALAAGLGSALSGAFSSTVQQRLIPAESLSRVGAIDAVGAFAFGPVAFIAVGPEAAVFGPRAVLAFGAAWSAAMTLGVLASPAIRHLPWPNSDRPNASLTIVVL
jgi:hypothetical protein